MLTPVAITDPALLERLNLSDAAFFEHFMELISHFPPREWTEKSFEHGLRYPWYRPERSYLLRDGEVTLLHDLDTTERGATVARHLEGRVALLAFGSNVAPKNLAIKLAHHEAPEDREVLVLAGDLHDLDVVATASVAAYGAVPATLAPSPGTRVRAALLLITATQLTTLTWGEMPYRVGRLHGAQFTVEEGIEGIEVESPLAFISRWGAFAPDGVPVPLAAIPAEGRSAAARTQLELLDHLAELVLGPDGGGARELTRRISADTGAMAARCLPAVRPYAQPFDYAGWAPMAPDGTI
jgi:hypothetical protein